MVDLSLLGAGETEIGVPVRPDQRNQVISHRERVIDLTSEDESLLSDPFGVSLTEVRDTDLQSDGEIEDEPSESLSWLEDVLEEVGDEQLFDGGKSEHAPFGTLHDLTYLQKKTHAPLRKRAHTDSFCVRSAQTNSSETQSRMRRSLPRSFSRLSVFALRSSLKIVQITKRHIMAFCALLSSVSCRSE
jgi:hypothetical protein